jgi:predicted alpha/beta hydrolase
MAHGFTGTMDWILPDFAEIFAAGGFAVLTFDYRFLGASAGQPRQLIQTRHQYADLRAAVAYARAVPGIDSDRIALWGTSLGGSYVVNLAAEDTSIAAVVANVPGLDLITGVRGRYVPPHLQLSRWKIGVATLRLVAAGLLDAIRGAVGLSPYYIAVYGRLGHAVFYDPDLGSLFEDLERHAPTWRNRVTPRFLFTAPRYHNGTMERIMVPLMVTVARDDEVVSTAFIKQKASKAPDHLIREYPVRHFDMYHGAVRDEVAGDHLKFFRRHLLELFEGPRFMAQDA